MFTRKSCSVIYIKIKFLTLVAKDAKVSFGEQLSMDWNTLAKMVKENVICSMLEYDNVVRNAESCAAYR